MFSPRRRRNGPNPSNTTVFAAPTATANSLDVVEQRQDRPFQRHRERKSDKTLIEAIQDARQLCLIALDRGVAPAQPKDLVGGSMQHGRQGMGDGRPRAPPPGAGQRRC